MTSFRQPPALAIAGLLATLGAIPLLVGSLFFIVVPLGCALFAIWAWRAGTDVTPDGLRVRALLVNGARGPVVSTDALTAEVASGRLCAALDVTEPEPLPADHPLWTIPNVLITPHTAGSVRGVFRRGYALVGDQIRRYVAGEPLENVVRDGY